MRTRLLPGLVEALSRNLARQQPRVRLFELGKVFTRADDGAPLETPRIAAAATGLVQAEQWGVAGRGVGFHDLRGDLDSLAALAGAALEYRPSQRAWAHPGRSADVHRVDGEGDAVACIGWIGELHPRLLERLGIDHPVLAFELDQGALQRRAVPRARPLSRFPSVRRDLAFIVPADLAWDALAATIRDAAGPSLRELRLFDVYTGKGVETGFKSVATGLILQDDSRTLTDRDVEQVVAAATAAAGSAHGARIRD